MHTFPSFSDMLQQLVQPLAQMPVAVCKAAAQDPHASQHWPRQSHMMGLPETRLLQTHWHTTPALDKQAPVSMHGSPQASQAPPPQKENKDEPHSLPA